MIDCVWLEKAPALAVRFVINSYRIHEQKQRAVLILALAGPVCHGCHNAPQPKLDENLFPCDGAQLIQYRVSYRLLQCDLGT